MFHQFCLRNLLLPAIEFSTGARFWTEYRRAARRDFQASASRGEVQAQLLATLLNTAASTPLHRDRLNRTGVSNAPVSPTESFDLLRRLAPIGKSDIRRNFPDGVTTPNPSGDRTYISTSGTTERLTVVADFEKRDFRRASGFHALSVALLSDVGVRCVEIPPNACNVVCGLDDGKSPPSIWEHGWAAMVRGQLLSREFRAELHGWVERRVLQRRQTLRPIEPGPADKLRSVLDQRLAEVARERPVHLSALPHYLLWLADRKRTREIAWPALQAVSPYGGLASPRMIERIESGFGVPFRNLYGTNELGVIAASCGQSLHILDTLFVVEIMNDGRPVADGELGEIVITDLRNLAMPLIRYRVGDVGRIWNRSCSCGRTTPHLEVLGRVQEMLTAADRPIPPTEVADAFFQDPGISNVKVEEFSSGRFNVSLVANPDGPPPDINACRDRFAALHGSVRQITCRTAAFLQPESSGKYKFVAPARRAVEAVQ